MDPSQWAGQSDACVPQTTAAAGPDRVTKLAYDEVGRVTSTTSAYGTAAASVDATTSYTPNGQVASVTDANGNKTAYAYDGFDRLVTTTYPSTTTGSGTTNAADYEQLGYDAAGNVTSRRLRDGQTIGYTYDALNRRTLLDLSGNGIDLDISYGYDLAGRLVSASNPSGHLTYYRYDALGRATGERTTYGDWKTSDYDAAGRRTRLAWPDGFYVTYEYDQAGAMTAIRENGSGLLATFGYDDLGRRTSLARGNGTTTGYTYDAVSRLSGLTQDLAGTASDQSWGYGYNPAGQVTTRTASNDAYAWTGAVNVDRGYATNGLNQYTASGSIVPSYDAKGNLTSAGPQRYYYSQQNQLYTTPDVGLYGQTLYYDPLGRLDLVYDWDRNPTFDYDGDRLVTEGQYGGAAVARRYVWGPGTDEPLVWYEGAGTGDKRWLHADERGSIVAVSDASGTATAINAYDEYGIPGAANQGRFQYTGQKWLPGLGFYDYKARMYSPTLGRFLQTDPIGYGDGPNWYNYVRSDPVNRRDPSGLQEQDHKDDEVDVDIVDDVVVIGERPRQAGSAASTAPRAPAIDFPSGIFGNGGSAGPQNTTLESRGARDRGRAARPDGTPKPNKHIKPDPKRPGWVIDSGKPDGKPISRPARHGEPGYSGPPLNYSAGDALAGAAVVVVVGGVTLLLAPEIAAALAAAGVVTLLAN